MKHNVEIPHHFITIEGNIGAGKTTLCNKIARDMGYRLILEQFADNPFLPNFYKNPERYAFTVELFFMTERHKQLQEELTQQDLFQNAIVSDYIFFKTLLFARNNLSTEEYRLFQRLFNILNASFPKPDLLVYLHRPVPNLLENIQKRGRSYEQDISSDYLLQIQQAYFEFFKTDNQLPVLILDVEKIDFLKNEAHYERIIELISKKYAPGIHRLSI
jgi:deoxyguanosine kinase